MGMLRQLRRRKQKKAFKAIKQVTEHDSVWMDKDGLHVVGMCEEPDKDFYDELTSQFQRNIIESELWEQMVEEYGEDKAKELLNECKAVGNAQHIEPTPANSKKHR